MWRFWWAIAFTDPKKIRAMSRRPLHDRASFEFAVVWAALTLDWTTTAFGRRALRSPELERSLIMVRKKNQFCGDPSHLQMA